MKYLLLPNVFLTCGEFGVRARSRSIWTSLMICVLLAFLPLRTTAQTTITTSGNCSPVVIGGNAAISINCTDKDLEIRLSSALQRNVSDLQSKINEALRRATGNADQVRRLTADQRGAQQTIEQAARANSSMLQQLSALRTEAATNSKRLEADLLQIQRQFGLSSQFTENLILQTQNGINREFDAILVRVDATEIRLSVLKDRLVEVEDNVRVIMNRFLIGDLQENKYFFGTSIRAGRLGSLSSHSIDFELELLSNVGRSQFGAVSYYTALRSFRASESIQNTTLPGAPPIPLVDSGDSTAIAIGGRIYIPNKIYGNNLYFGGEASYSALKSAGAGSGVGFNALLGIEWASKSSRIAAEFGIGKQKAQVNTLIFSATANSTLERKISNQNNVFGGLRVSFH